MYFQEKNTLKITATTFTNTLKKKRAIDYLYKAAFVYL